MSRPTPRTFWAVELYRRGKQLELMHRALGFATLALVTLAPLLIVVAAAAPYDHGGFALWLVDGMDLSGRSAEVLTRVFGPPHRAVSTTSLWGGLLLAVFGLSFAASVQNGYERVWRLPSGPWHRIWRQAVWLGVLTVYLYLQVQTRTVLAGNERMLMSLGTGVLFFWWGPHFLLGRQVRWRLLFPGAVATMVGLVGLRTFSYLVFTPLIVTQALSYGAIGTILVVESWLIGAGFVVYGGALVGHLICDRTGRLLDHEEPPQDASASGERRSG
ncbi:ribonuclease BN [Streptomyces thermodiastaticus]|uniref:ribonuclease BN n=1 Tax=Streptomyces thermodiastaticus TaxID=44061 RepID=UPI00199472C4|nr:ribonuclease BN [Streptomyces thermodiastaticus]MCE7549639.1 ribonuclease BN [Streptomyces thermodiastaticus]GHF56567.1 hypothetical protein GCM10018787_00730 [Streptomyces thermodiastaticus]